MSDESTASLRIKYESVGTEAVKKEAAEVKAASVTASKEILNAHVFLYQERMRLQKEWAAAANQREREVAQAIRIQSAAAAQAYKTQAAAEKQAAREAANAQKQAAREKAQAEKQASREAALAAREAANAQKQAAREKAAAEKQASREAIQAAREAANAQKQAAREKAAAEKQASREAIQAAREAANAQKQAARESAQSTKSSSAQTRVGLGFVAGQGISVGGLASVSPYAAAAVATAYAVKNVTSDLVQEAAKWEKMAIALGDIEGSGERANKVIGDLYELAKRPGIGLKEAEQTYIQFRALNMEGEKAQRVIKAVSNAVALSGGGATEFERVNYQITQMLSKGKVLEEDLRIMRNSLPRLTTAMREAFGTTTAEGIRKAGVNAEQFVDAITVQFEKLPTATQTLESEIENLETAWSKAKASFVDTEFWKGLLANTTSLLEAFVDIRKEIENADRAEGEQKKAYSENALLGWLKRTGANYAPGGLEISGELAAGTGAQRTQLQLQSDAIIRAMQTGMGGAMSAQLRANNALTGYWADEAAKANAVKPEEKKKKTKSVQNPLDVVGDKNFLTVDQLQGRSLLEAQQAIEKALMADRDKANAEALKIAESQAEMELKIYEEEGAKLLAVQAKLDELHKADIDKQNAEDQKRAEDKIKALQELREAEASEYQLRLIQIETWGEQMKARVGDDESAITRIMEEQAFRRKMVYADAWGQILGGSSSFFGSMAALSKQYNEDNTREYAKWVAISQGLAIAEATLNIGVAMAKAMKSGFTTLDGLAQMAVVASAGGQILNSIASMNAAKVGKGAFDKGGSLGYGEFGIAGENGPEIITGPARIASTRDSARILGAKSSLSVNVHNYASAQVDVQQRDDGSIDVIVNKMASQIEERLASGVATGTGVLNRAVVGAYGLRRNGR